MEKSLESSEIVVTHGSGIMASPFDCSNGHNDDNDDWDSGGGDHGKGDRDGC